MSLLNNRNLRRAAAGLLTAALLAAPAFADETKLVFEKPEQDGAKPLFTMVWISDTQNMSRGMYAPVGAMANWIEQNAENRNIKVCFHTGDMVTAGGIEKQWFAIAEHFNRIINVVPFVTAAGNHDVGGKGFEYDYYLEHCPRTVTAEKDLYREGRNQCFRFETEAGPFVAVSVGSFDVKDEANYAWLNDAFQRNADATGILITHDYQLGNGSLTSTGRYLFDNVVKTCPNIKYVLCGHSHGASNVLAELDDDGDGETDRSVVQMMYDIQDDEKKTGYFRILSFMPDRSMRVESYSAFKDDYNYSDTSKDESFVIENGF